LTKTTKAIVVSTKNYDALKVMGRYGDTFDTILSRILSKVD
jgi:hypothetical protein